MHRSTDPEQDALGRWLAAGYGPALRTAYLLLHNQVDAEDAVQEAFLRAWRFRTAIPAGDGMQPWMYRVVVNACLSKLRSEGRRRARAQSQGGESDTDRADDPETSALGQDMRSSVVAAIGAIPDHLRVVVVLRYYSQLSEQEIASIIRRRPGTVKSRLHEARRLLSEDPRLRHLVDVDLVADGGEAR